MTLPSQASLPPDPRIPTGAARPWIVLALMLALTVLVSLYAHNTVRREAQERFQAAAESAQRDVQERMNSYVGVLLGASGLFAAIPVVDVHQFRAFAERMEVRTRFPGMAGIGYSRVVPPDRRERFDAVLRRLGPDFRMWPAGERPEYHAIMFLEPMDRRNRRAIGYDMFTDPVRRAAMTQARDTGLPAASGRVTLVQDVEEDRQPGFLLYAPVYDRGRPLLTVDQRQAALKGFVFSPVRIRDMMNTTLADPTDKLVDVAIYDGTRIAPENLMYATDPEGTLKGSPPLRSVKAFEFAGHTWTVVYTPSPQFDGAGAAWLTWAVPLSGLLFTGLIFWFTLSEARARAVEERSAQDLRTSGEALRRSQEDLSLIADAIPALVSYISADGRYRLVNRTYEEWFRVSRDRIQGRHMREVLGEDAYEIIRPHVETVLTGQPVRFETRIPYETTGTRYVDIHYIPQFGPGGRVEGFVALVADITERKQLEEGLRESEARFRTMADTAPVMLWMSGTDTLCNYFNKPWLDFRGRAMEQEVGTGWTEGVHPEDARRCLEEYILAFSRRENFQMEYRLRRHDGEYRWVLNRGVPRFTPDRSFAGYIGSCLDITDRKRAEEKERFLAEASTLLASSLDYRTTLHQVARLAVPGLADWCAVDMLESDGTARRLAVAHADPEKEQYAWELWRRYPPRPDASHGLMRVLKTGESDLYPEVSDELLRAATYDEEHYRIAKELGLKSGIVVPLVARGRILGAITVVSSESGRRYGPEDLAFMEDLAHRAAIAADNARLFGEVQENDRRKDEFLATLAHELRNPLAPMLNAVHLLRERRAGDTPPQAEEVLERQVRHMARLVDDLLDVSRISRGQIELRREPVELATGVEHAVQTSRPLIEERRHTLHVALPPEPVLLHADPTRLVQVVANLLNNAAKYTDQGGRIDLTGERAGEEVLIRVRDTGRGIKPEMLPRVFDLFAQEDPSLDRMHGGLGLGLTLVKQLVERHGGSVTAFSEGPGKGSEFVVRLPIYHPSPGETPAAQAPPSVPERVEGTESRRVLVVDDNQDAVQMLEEVLNMWGHEVRTAYDGREALEAARSFRPDVVLLDIGLPEMDGYEVARRIREDPGLDGVTLIALTGFGQESDRLRSEEAGFDRHLTKPVDLNTLQSLVSGGKEREVRE